MENTACYLTFPSIHHAMMAEKAFKTHDLAVRMVPIPREITASCGLAAEYPPPLSAAVEKVVQEENLQVEERHQLTINPRRKFWDKFLG